MTVHYQALFRSSLPHPLADCDYAMYEVGEGCEVTNLIPGVDLLSEKYRADGRQLVAALRWVVEELARGQHNLFVSCLIVILRKSSRIALWNMTVMSFKYET